MPCPGSFQKLVTDYKYLFIVGTDTDLSSVTKMIDATDPLNFKAFFNSDHTEDITSSSSPSLASIAHRKPAPGLLSHPALQIPSDYAKAIHRELDNLQKEGDVDESALSQVREMALSVKEECATATPTSSSNQTGRTVSPTESQNEGSVKDVSSSSVD